MGDLKANLGLNGSVNGHGSGRSHAGGGCCSSTSPTGGGKSTWTWLLFVLVLVSLAASILVFWMTLYKQQELQMRLMGLEEERNRTLQEMVGREVSIEIEIMKE